MVPARSITTFFWLLRCIAQCGLYHASLLSRSEKLNLPSSSRPWRPVEQSFHSFFFTFSHAIVGRIILIYQVTFKYFICLLLSSLFVLPLVHFFYGREDDKVPLSKLAALLVEIVQRLNVV